MDDIEKVARAMCEAVGANPDYVVMGGPCWHGERLNAKRAIAAHRVLSSEWSSSARPALSEAD